MRSPGSARPGRSPRLRTGPTRAVRGPAASSPRDLGVEISAQVVFLADWVVLISRWGRLQSAQRGIPVRIWADWSRPHPTNRGFYPPNAQHEPKSLFQGTLKFGNPRSRRMTGRARRVTRFLEFPGFLVTGVVSPRLACVQHAFPPMPPMARRDLTLLC
jgi:hypothetical protein